MNLVPIKALVLLYKRSVQKYLINKSDDVKRVADARRRRIEENVQIIDLSLYVESIASRLVKVRKISMTETSAETVEYRRIRHLWCLRLTKSMGYSGCDACNDEYYSSANAIIKRHPII